MYSINNVNDEESKQFLFIPFIYSRQKLSVKELSNILGARRRPVSYFCQLGRYRQKYQVTTTFFLSFINRRHSDAEPEVVHTPHHHVTADSYTHAP
jgi:hypothetical protein